MPARGRLRLPALRPRCAAVRARDRRTSCVAGGSSTFYYRFHFDTPVLGGRLMSPQGLEVPLVFANTDIGEPYTGGGSRAQTLSDKMSAAWLAFAETGNPNTEASGLPTWPRYRPTRRSRWSSRRLVVLSPARKLRSEWLRTRSSRAFGRCLSLRNRTCMPIWLGRRATLEAPRAH
jgi:carboxylesterase type B